MTSQQFAQAEVQLGQPVGQTGPLIQRDHAELHRQKPIAFDGDYAKTGAPAPRVYS
jgi:hypothetical protein